MSYIGRKVFYGINEPSYKSDYCKGCLEMRWDLQTCTHCSIELCKQCTKNRKHNNSFKCNNCNNFVCTSKRISGTKRCWNCYE